MNTGRSRSSRVFTISFPERLAREVDQVAKEESRNLSELFREAFRTYRAERIRQRLIIDRQYAQSRNSREYRKADVEHFVDEARSTVGPGEKKKKR
ncbi:MAG TPA: ribbon-helix-helix protein, CopG family [Candidatus Angelobacter sp.]|jgi:metal-responsive CopG/Arc/MetJ family transcriptional regulator|nr:ribbon-helix-helix protein, CopG family [Candidatus Angelobacter sp.]